MYTVSLPPQKNGARKQVHFNLKFQKDEIYKFMFLVPCTWGVGISNYLVVILGFGGLALFIISSFRVGFILLKYMDTINIKI